MNTTNEMLTFAGFLCPGILFESGHCIWLLNWESTPQDIPLFSQVWIFYPNGKRIGYVSNDDAKPLLDKYHQFDSTRVATINIEHSEDFIHVQLYGKETDSFSIYLTLAAAATSDSTSSDFTETGYEVHHHAHTVYPIREATGFLDDLDLGAITTPTKLIELGSCCVPDFPFVSICTHRVAV